MFLNCCKRTAGDGSFELKHVALCEVALKCCVGQHIFVFSSSRSVSLVLERLNSTLHTLSGQDETLGPVNLK